MKSLAISKITYSVTNTAEIDNFTQKLNKILYSYLWDKKERIKRNTLIGKIEWGGIEMLDIQSRVKRILSSSAPWSIIGKDIITKFNKNRLLLYVNDPEIKYLEKLPPFYKQVFQGLIKTNSIEFREIKTLTVLLNQSIWCNKHITLHNGNRSKKTTLFLQNWIDSNLLFVKDLRFDRGKLDVTYILEQVNTKTNIWAEIFQVKNSLSKYSTILSGFQDQIIRCKIDMTRIGLSRKQITWTTKEVYNEHIENIFVKPKLKILSGRENLKDTSNNEISNAFKIKVK